MKFGDRLKELREENGLTQKSLAEILGVSTSTLVKYERNEREPKYGNLMEISDYFDVSIDYLLGKSTHKSIESNSFNNTTNFITYDNITDLINVYYKDYGESIYKIINDFLSPVVALDFKQLDTLYMLLNLNKEFIELSTKGLSTFISYIDGCPVPNEFIELDDMLKIQSKTSNLRHLLDRYISIILSKEFYNRIYTEERDYFADEIMNYSNKEKEKRIRCNKKKYSHFK